MLSLFNIIYSEAFYSLAYNFVRCQNSIANKYMRSYSKQ